mgnify:FL=1|tara:strand:- start:114 stop:563 length:450 start_codon:yes stop_codon:yes gene_type:complete
MHQETKSNNIKIIKLVNGDDIVAVVEFTKRQLDPKNRTINIERPLQIKYVPQITSAGFKDYIALIRWTAYTDDEQITIPKDKIMTITTANDAMSRSYQGVVDTYEDIPLARDKVKHAKVQLSTNANKRINEIFDDNMDFWNDDDEGTLH